MCEIGSIPKRESWFLSALDIIGMCIGKPFPAALNDCEHVIPLKFLSFLFFSLPCPSFLFKRKETRLVVVLGGSKDEAEILSHFIQLSVFK